MLRLILIIALHLPHCLGFYIKAKKALKNKNMTPKDRFIVIKSIISTICKKSRITVELDGEENLPEKDGYVLVSNHQGRFDGLAHIMASSRGVTFLIDEKRSNILIEKTVVDALDCIRIDRSNLKKTRASLEKMIEKINGGSNVVIFPEGGWADNKNTLQQFKTGALGEIYDGGFTVVPVCLYDTYKVYGVNSLKKVSCRVRYLKPITHGEYKDLSRAEFASLIRERIGEEIVRIENEITVKTDKQKQGE